jgi:hypothetical protein
VVGFDFSDGRPAFDKDRCFAHPEAVLDVCGGLVVMSQGTAFCNDIRRFLIHAIDGVTLAHLTVKEFLLEQESPLHVNEPDAHSFIARSCLTYLLDLFQPRVTAGVGDSLCMIMPSKIGWTMPRPPREIEDTKSVIYELALEVLHPGHETFRLWLWAIHCPRRIGTIYPTPLFVSARWGFQNLTATLLVLGVRSATQSSSGGTALHLASEHGHFEVRRCSWTAPISR